MVSPLFSGIDDATVRRRHRQKEGTKRGARCSVKRCRLERLLESSERRREDVFDDGKTNARVLQMTELLAVSRAAFSLASNDRCDDITRNSPLAKEEGRRRLGRWFREGVEEMEGCFGLVKGEVKEEGKVKGEREKKLEKEKKSKNQPLKPDQLRLGFRFPAGALFSLLFSIPFCYKCR
jgi:hypothetical protein